MNDVVISVSDVSKCYRVFDDQRSRLLHALLPRHTGGVQEVWALKDINFEIKRGESVAIIGRNGGGKSTLLEILTGTLTPTTGKVTVKGRVSALLELGSGFNPEYSGRDNVILNGLLLGLSKKEILSRFSEIEAFAEIGVAIDRPVKTYSSGMVMRLAFAVQVLCDPDILIVDEALSVGDYFFQQKCLSYIRKLNANGVTLLFVSHDMGTVREICTRGILLKSGQIDYCGDQLEAIRLFFQSQNGASSEKAEHALSAAQIPTQEIAIAKPIWKAEAASIDADSAKKAQILAVGLFDENGDAATSIRMASRATVAVHFRSCSDTPIHVHISFKNKYGQMLTAVGSYSLKIEPLALDLSQEARFELSIQMSFEAGDYVLSVNLGTPSEDRTSGTIFDETPWIGPFQVVWNYIQEVPPFYGLTGMNTAGKFFTYEHNANDNLLSA